MDEKMIRFIDTGYKELFCIPDGGYIQINNGGESRIRQCHYNDPTHVKVGSRLYHIHELVLALEHARATIEPVVPEIIQGYVITDKTTVGDKTIVMAHNPDAVAPHVTWQQLKGREGYDLGHYYKNRNDAETDFFLRADAERTGAPYQPYMPPQKNRDDAR